MQRVRQRLPALQEVELADGMQLPERWAGKFDICVSNFGVIFFESPERGVREMLRVLRPGGWLLFSAWEVAQDTEAFQVFPSAVRQVGKQAPPVPSMHETGCT